MSFMIIQPPISSTDEEIMYTVTTTITKTATTTPFTGLQWLPHGAVTDTVRLTAGPWAMLLWRPAPPSGMWASDFQYGYRIVGGSDVLLANPLGNTGVVITGGRIDLATDSDIEVIGRTTKANGTSLFAPGDVIAFAPLPA